MKAKTILVLVVLLVFAAVVGPFAAHVIGFLVGSAVTVAMVGGGTYVGYRVGRVRERSYIQSGNAPGKYLP